MESGVTARIPVPAEGRGQWALGYREPLNAAEQIKKDDDPLDVRERIYQYAKTGYGSIFAADLRARFRWYGLYTQRPESDGYFMLRIRIPGGVLTSDQLRTIGRLSQEFGRDVADVTDRQNVQLHWVRIEDVPSIWDRLAAAGLDTTEACGDTPRNILGCPLAGVDAGEVIDAGDLVRAVHARLVGTKEFSNLPRKFKMSITGCRHQCAVHEIMDLGLVGHELDDGSLGFDVWAGGGLGPTPRFADRLGVFVRPEQVVDVCAAVVGVFRDYGYRRSRNRARLKFLLADWGPETFRDVVSERLGFRLDDGPPAKPSTEVHRDHTGVGRQHDGLNTVGFPLRSGRVTGTDLISFAEVAERAGSGRLRATPQQKLVVLDVPDDGLAETMQELERIGYPVFASPFRTGMMACTGVEFCKLAIVDTKARSVWLYEELERRLPGFDEQIRINVNGCPNSCARYQLADIGFVGVLVNESGSSRKGGSGGEPPIHGGAGSQIDSGGPPERIEAFNVHLGGGLGAERGFGRKVSGLRLRADELPSFCERLLRVYAQQRNGVRSFGEWLNHHSDEDIRALARTAAHGLERVGPKPVAAEGIRQL